MGYYANEYSSIFIFASETSVLGVNFDDSRSFRLKLFENC